MAVNGNGGNGKSPRNKTMTITPAEARRLSRFLLSAHKPMGDDEWKDRIICRDMLAVCPLLPAHSMDLILMDPPYNIAKNFNGAKFAKMTDDDYEHLLDGWIGAVVPLLKPGGSVYICGDWRSSSAVYRAAKKHLIVRNRITWEREKGRGAKANWKNCSEDIWFCTLSDDYVFNKDAVGLRRKVIAPYRGGDGLPRGWESGEDGNFRMTAPSNLWSDITVPFWSMAENTEHPTQKPEKLAAKLILASSHAGQMIFDPFLGSGTFAVVAKKLGRHFCGVEIDNDYCCLALKRLAIAKGDVAIQGYKGGVFWERNSAVANRPQLFAARQDAR